MSLQAPPRLLQLLPMEIFPLLFMVALTEGCSKTPTAVVQAWPFPRLPLGVLMKMPHLETLRVVRPSGCLKTPLESLTISECRLRQLETATACLFLCPSMHQLKELDPSGIILSDFNPEPFQTLLENVAATLQVLILDDCWITDFQLSVILPALSRCHQLITFNFCGNQISEAVLENLFRHTVKLSSLSLVVYPVPDECYDCYTDMDPKPCFQLHVRVTEILRDLRQPKRIEFRSLRCPYCFYRLVIPCIYGELAMNMWTWL
uniref:Uncharacterized protein n=1 Tax=Prolemur simus TaxID=1328070 RepID=A0A8C9AYD8_PROSS